MDLRYRRERHPRRCRHRGVGNYRRGNSAGSAGHGLPSRYYIIFWHQCRRELHRIYRQRLCGRASLYITPIHWSHPSHRPADPGRPHSPSGTLTLCPKGALWPPSRSERKIESKVEFRATTTEPLSGITQSRRFFSAGVRLPKAGKPCAFGVHQGL